MGEMTKLRKGLWSPNEDEKLSRCIANYVNGTWNDIARMAGLARCGKSCRRRWMNHLRPALKKGRFTPTEINQIIELQRALGNRWSKIAEHFVGRTDNDVKNLWNTQMRGKRKNKMIMQPTHVEVKDDEAITGQDTNDFVNFNDKNTNHRLDVRIDLVLDAKTNSSQSTSSSSHSSHHHDENNINTTINVSNSHLTSTHLSHIDLISKDNNLTPILPFPFDYTSLFSIDPQGNIIKDEPLIRDSIVNTFPTPLHMHSFDANQGYLTNINKGSPHIPHKCTFQMHHVPLSLSGSNFNKLSSSHIRTTQNKKGLWMDHWHMDNVCNAVTLPYLEVNNNVEFNLNQVEKQKSIQVSMSNSALLGIGSHHRSVKEVPTMDSNRQDWSFGKSLNKTLNEDERLKSTNSSTSTYSSTIDSHLFSLLQSKSPCKRETNSMLPKEWHLLDYAKRDESNAMGTLPSSLMDGYVEVDKALEVFGSSISEGSKDNRSWWSTLEVPCFEVPTNLELWQPLEMNEGNLL